MFALATITHHMSSAKRRHNQAPGCDHKLMRRYIKHQTNVLERRRQQLLSRTHAEDVHQMRVATRRLRAALSMLQGGRTKPGADLRWLTRKLGAVRDLDVLMEQLDDKPAEQRYKDYLRKQWVPARRKLVHAVQTRRMQQMLTELGAVQHKLKTNSTAVRHDLNQTLTKQLKQLARTGGRLRADSPFERLHRLRIASKRLRYQLEVLQPQPDQPLGKVLAELKRLLIRLGELQDTRVAVATLLDYEHSLAPHHSDHAVVEKMINQQERRAEQIRDRFPTEWRRFETKLKQAIRAME
jgi:CHAD domain-containing protein